MTHVPAIGGLPSTGPETRPHPGAPRIDPGRRALPPAARVEIGTPEVPAAPAAVPVDADPVVLRAIATWAAPAALREVASRPALDPVTARAVYARGDWKALRALAANADSELPSDVLDGLVGAARLDAVLAAALSARADLPASKAALVARAHRASAEEERVGEASGVEVGSRRDRASGTLVERGDKADEAVDLLAKLRPLRLADIAYCLNLGRIDEAMAVISRMAGVPTPAAIRAYEQGDIGYALQQMRSLGLDTSTANWLLGSLGRSPVPQIQTGAASRAYAETHGSTERTPSPAMDLRI